MLEEASFSPGDKARMLLVALGLRRGAVVSFSELYASPHDLHNATEYIAAAHKLGIATDTAEHAPDSQQSENNKPVSLDLFMSRTDEAVHTLKAAWQAGEAVDGGRAMGLALGYPQTAVEAYASKDTTIHRTETGDLRVQAFGDFMLSSDEVTADEERAIVLSWADAIKQASPKIYDQVMNRHS